MGCNGCRGFVAFLLKILNFVQAFIGAAMIFYSIWMLNHWKSHIKPHPQPPPPPPSPYYPPQTPPPTPSPSPYFPPAASPETHAPTPSPYFPPAAAAPDFDFSFPYPTLGFQNGEPRFLRYNENENNQERSNSRKLGQASGMVSGLDLHADKVPAPWFIYTCLAIGIIVCVVTCFGHIAAEITHGCCLCCYSVLIVVLILLEAALVGYIFFDRNWEKDVPDDPTGEFETMKQFIKENIGICKWVGLTVVIIQAFSLLLAMVLRAMVSIRKPEYDSDEEYNSFRGRQPLLNQQGGQEAQIPGTGENTSSHIDAWTKRMREKYGLNPNEFAYGSSDPKSSEANATSSETTQRRCSIM